MSREQAGDAMDLSSVNWPQAACVRGGILIAHELLLAWWGDSSATPVAEMIGAGMASAIAGLGNYQL